MKSSRTSGLPWSLDRQVSSAFDKEKWIQRNPDASPQTPGQINMLEPPKWESFQPVIDQFDPHSYYSDPQVDEIIDAAHGLGYERELRDMASDAKSYGYENASESFYSDPGDYMPPYADSGEEALRMWRDNELEPHGYPYDPNETMSEEEAQRLIEYIENELRDQFEDQWLNNDKEYGFAHYLERRLSHTKESMPLSPDDPGLPQVYYHVSPSENHDNIMAGGLIPGAGPSPWMKAREDGKLAPAPYGVYLWDDPDNAMSYAHTLANEAGELAEKRDSYWDDNPEWFIGDYDEEADEYGEPYEKSPEYNVYAINAEDIPDVRMDPENSLRQRPSGVPEGSPYYGERSFDDAMREYNQSYNPMYGDYDAEREEGHRYYSPNAIPASAIRLHRSMSLVEMDHNSWDEVPRKMVPEVFTRVPDLMTSPLADPNWKTSGFDRSKWENRSQDMKSPHDPSQMTMSSCPYCGSPNIVGEYPEAFDDLDDITWECEDCGEYWPKWQNRQDTDSVAQADTTKATMGYPELDYSNYLDNSFEKSRGYGFSATPYYDPEDIQKLYNVADNRGEMQDLLNAYEIWREEQYERANELEELNWEYLNDGRPDYEEDPEGHDNWFESDDYRWRYEDLMNEQHPTLSSLERFEELLAPHRQQRTAAQFEEAEPCPYCLKVDSYGLDELPGLRACRSCGMAWRTDPITKAETPGVSLDHAPIGQGNVGLTDWAKNYQPTAQVEGLDSNPQVQP